MGKKKREVVDSTITSLLQLNAKQEQDIKALKEERRLLRGGTDGPFVEPTLEQLSKFFDNIVDNGDGSGSASPKE